MKNQPLQAHNRHRPDVDDTAAVVNLSAGSTIRKIDWSYNGTPTGGELTITVGGTAVWSQYVTAGGPGFHDFTEEGVNGAYGGGAIVVTLAAGGAVKGQVSVILGQGV